MVLSRSICPPLLPSTKPHGYGGELLSKLLTTTLVSHSFPHGVLTKRIQPQVECKMICHSLPPPSIVISVPTCMMLQTPQAQPSCRSNNTIPPGNNDEVLLAAWAISKQTRGGGPSHNLKPKLLLDSTRPPNT